EKRVAQIEKEILSQRSKFSAQSVKTEVPRPPSPDKAHGPAILSAGAGVSNKGSFADLTLKPVLHDLISREDGYEPLTQIDMLKLSLRFNNRYEKVFIDGFDFIRIFSIAELRNWVKKLSWNLSLGTDADYRKNTDGLKYISYVIRGGPGIGFSTHIIKRETYFLFWENRFQTDTEPNAVFYSGIMGGFVLKISDLIDMINHYSICHSILSTGSNREFIQKIYSELALHLSDSRDIRLKGKITDFDYYEYTLSVALFF
ncbi:MAG: hypothetical protein N3B13_03865, partial [Deltaproteobacteria bacterium]|nr:hypothetical protein [Deltaproteobacteria bacterium]